MNAAAAWDVARQIPGWLTAAEARFLFDAARAVPADGRIVEVGSFLGRSTVCLALGSAAGGGAEVVAVDPHIGSPRHAAMLACTDTWPHFLANLERTGVRRLVRPLHATSAGGAAATAGPVQFLFVDGSHELADVRTDIACWFPKLAPGALVAFHDSWHMQGVRRATSELLRTRAGLRAPRLVDTITALTCTASESPAPGHRAFRVLRWLRGPAGFLRLTWRGTRLTPVAPAAAS